MFYQKFLIRLILFITLGQLVHGAALKKGKGKKPKQPSKPKATTTITSLASTSTSTACLRKLINTVNQGNCMAQTNAPWSLQRISQIPWTGNVADFLKNMNSDVFTFNWYDSWGKDVIIYVLDSEVNAGHSAFTKGQIERGILVSGATPILHPEDHGTGVASCIVGRNNGIARKAKIFPIKLPFTSVDKSKYITEALTIAKNDWTARSDKNPDLRAIVNISWSMPAHPLLHDALKLAISSGMHVIHAAGNSGANRCYDDTPASDSNRKAKMVGQIVVGGFTSTLNPKKDKIIDTFVKYSTHGPCIDLLAPSNNIMAAYGNKYKTVHGTTYAAAITSGVIAALLSSHPGYRNLNPVDLKKKFLAEFTKKGIEGLPSDTEDRMLTIEKLLKP